MPLESEDWDRPIGIGRRRSYKKRDIICSEADPANEYFIILAGTVEIFKDVQGAIPPGGLAAEIRLALLEAGASFGERCLFGHQRAASARAYQDSDLLVIDGVALAAILERDDGLASRFYRALCVKISNILGDVESDLRHLHRRLTFY